MEHHAANEFDDGELALLARYLAGVAALPNLRAIEKRGWREQVVGAPGGR